MVERNFGGTSSRKEKNDLMSHIKDIYLLTEINFLCYGSGLGRVQDWPEVIDF